jgi:transcriptional antiterminator RfaH
MKNWYVAHSKPRSEEFLWRQFCLREIDSYYPCIEVQPVNPRSRKVQPYFPGYLFVHVDLGVIGQSVIQWMPGAVGLVRFGDEPATVSEGLITAIKQRIANLKTAVDDGLVLFRKGDRVKVEEGVFRGYEGIFDVRLSGTERVRILLSLLTHRQVAMELPASCLRLVD